MDRLTVLPGYESLASVLDEALAQAQSGKGKERHASGEAFEDQQICEIAARTGDGGPIFQLVKKAYESQRLEGGRGDAELLGTINYAVAAILERRRRRSQFAKGGTAGAAGGIVGEGGPDCQQVRSVVKLKVELDTEEAMSTLKRLHEEMRQLLPPLSARELWELRKAGN